MNRHYIYLTLFFSLMLSSCSVEEDNTNNDQDSTPAVYVGSRSSWYGFGSQYGYEEFPSKEALSTVYTNMAAAVEGSTPSAIWIITGVNIDSRDPFPDGTCHIEFRNPTGEEYPYMEFWGGDRHTPYLKEFDRIGAKIFLQVEPGLADVPTLIKLIFDKYGHHECIAGFGVDIEWYPSDGRTNSTGYGLNTPLDMDELAEWDRLVKEYNPEYRVFVKHWEPTFMGDGPVSDVIYINDSQNRGALDTLMMDYRAWAQRFYPNDCGWQFGYSKDEPWWCLYDDPFITIADRVKEDIPDQISHFFWVDFTLNHLNLAPYWEAE